MVHKVFSVFVAVICLLSYSTNSLAEAKKCTRFGIHFKRFYSDDVCFDTTLLTRTEVALNDPDSPNPDPNDLEFNSRTQADTKFYFDHRFGLLSTFIRFRGEYDPFISEDLIVGRDGEDFAVGLQSINVALDRPGWRLTVGEIENAGASFISNGFTDRGTESLDSRSGLGASLLIDMKSTDLIVSLNDPTETTGSQARLPNAGIGIKHWFGPWSVSSGFAVVNVDDFRTRDSRSKALLGRRPFEILPEATLGYGFGAELGYLGEYFDARAGVTYSKNASNDVIFSFSDGFDAATIYSAVHIGLTDRVFINGDLSFVTATANDLRHLNGIEAAANISWYPHGPWQFLAEVGVDNVDEFGAGDQFFFLTEKKTEVDALFQVTRHF